MNKNEFLNFLNESGDEFNDYLAARDNFRKDLSNQLTQFILGVYSTFNDDSDKLSKLKKESDMCASRAFDSLERTFSQQKSGQQYKQSTKLPQLISNEELQEEIAELQNLVPEEDYEYVEQICLEDFEHLNRVQQFKINIHNLVKKVLVDHFEEDILELDGQYFRYLDDNLFLMASFDFIDMVFELKAT